jgi:hypothetical protein
MLESTVNLANLEEYATYQLDRLPDHEDAYFALVEAPPAIIPLLISRFRSETEAARRAMIIKLIWQFRELSMIPVMEEALRDSSRLVWKEALDGLVSVGGPESISAVQAAYNRKFYNQSAEKEYQAFLDEALVQITAGIHGDSERMP